MQIILFIVITVALIVFLIYTINKKFGKKEFLILLTVLIIPLVGISFILNNIAGKVPNIFKEKYQKEKGIEVLKLTYERLNNKNISSNTNFIYNFDYIINKEGKEYFCTAKEVKVKKIEDEYIFENFNSLNEKCNEK